MRKATLIEWDDFLKTEENLFIASGRCVLIRLKYFFAIDFFFYKKG